MSGSDGDELEELVVEAVYLLQTTNYCIIAVLALLIYDHLLTFAGEVRFIWGRKFSVATIVFALNRYTTLLCKVWLAVSLLWWPIMTDQGCIAPVILVIIFTIVAYFISAIFSALRVYAVWDRDWRPFVVVLAVALVMPVTNMYHYIRSKPSAAPFPFYGCGQDLEISDEEFFRLSMVTHSFAIATDLLVVLLTWAKTYQIKRLATGLHVKTNLTSLLLRDGTVYFVVLLILNVLDLMMSNISSITLNPLTIFIDAFTCILISRFMLKLRQVANHGSLTNRNFTSTTSPSQMSSLQIATGIVGDLGAPLEHGTGWTTATTDWDTTYDSTPHETLNTTELPVAPEKGGPLWAGLLDAHDSALALTEIPPAIECVQIAGIDGRRLSAPAAINENQA